jgi:hypothetical protein
MILASRVDITRELGMAAGTAEGLARLYETGALDELVQWWNQRKGEALPEQRPVIRGEAGRKRNTGMYVDADVLERARVQAQAEKLRTGGTMSQLVELLLWQYVGSPVDLLARQ